jgi:hypothetical protein
MKRTRRIAGVLLPLLGLSLAGCAADMSGGRGAGPPDALPKAGPALAASPFAPASLRVFPLTRLDRDTDGRGIIVFHFELRDRWGDGVKWPGNLQIQLYRPTGNLFSGMEVQEREWSVTDMADPEGNSALFDPATRTYRVQLGGLPDWAEVLAGAARSESSTPYLKLRAVFAPAGPGGGAGEQRFLQDEFVITK